MQPERVKNVNHIQDGLVSFPTVSQHVGCVYRQTSEMWDLNDNPFLIRGEMSSTKAISFSVSNSFHLGYCRLFLNKMHYISEEWEKL